MQKRRPKRREGTTTQAGGDNLLRPLTTLELGYHHIWALMVCLAGTTLLSIRCIIIFYSLKHAYYYPITYPVAQTSDRYYYIVKTANSTKVSRTNRVCSKLIFFTYPATRLA